MSENVDSKIWTDGEDYVIAESLDEVKKILLEQGHDEDLEEYIEGFETMDTELDFTFNDEEAGKVTKTVDEWIKERGRGFFASVNY